VSGGGLRGWDLIGRDIIVRDLNNIVIQVLRGKCWEIRGSTLLLTALRHSFEIPEMGLLFSHRGFRSLNIFILAYDFWFPPRRTNEPFMIRSSTTPTAALLASEYR
jgi:hypothetical protein